MTQFTFDPYPNDIILSQCRHWTALDCFEACPTGARHVDQNTTPVYDAGEWKYKHMGERKLNREKVAAGKTIYCELEEWDPAAGRPTNHIPASLGLIDAAKALEEYSAQET